MKVINKTTQKVLADYLLVADTALKRLVGLLGENHLPVGKGLLITPCKGVHTFGMRFTIDVLFINKSNEIVAVARNLKPNRMTRLYRNAVSVLELPTDVLDATGTNIGDEVEFA